MLYLYKNQLKLHIKFKFKILTNLNSDILWFIRAKITVGCWRT